MGEGNGLWWVLGFAAFWFILNAWILPKFGFRT